jgi:hypothetical protein
MAIRAIIVFFVLCGTFCHGNELESFQLPLRYDWGEYIESNLVIEFVSERAEVLPMTTADKTNKFEIFFSELMTAIKDNNFNAVASSLTPVGKDVGNNTPENIFTWLHTNVTADKNIELLIYRRIFSRNDQEIIFWGWKSSDNNVAIATPLVKCGDKVKWHWSPNGNLSSFAMVCLLFRNDIFVKAKDGKREFSISLTDDLDSNAINLKFNGKKYCFNLLKDEVQSMEPTEEDQVLSFYQSFYLEKIESIKNSAEHYTPKSRKNILGALEKSPSYQDWLRESETANPAVVTFIMNANPIYIVFYKKQNSTHNLAAFEYVIKTEEGYKITNFGFHDIFDSVLNNNMTTIEQAVY